jgi:hypothetical protein
MVVAEGEGIGRGGFTQRDSASIDADPTYDPFVGSGGGGYSTARDEPGAVGRWLAGGSLAFAGLALMRRRRAR